MSARPRPELTGGARAKQRVAVLLAVLSGDCPVAEASRRLGVTPNRYYGLERQGLEGMLKALEGTKERHRTAAICKEHVRLEQEVLRLQALVRAMQRAAGLPPPAKPAKRQRKSGPRARKVIAQLRLATPDATTTPREE
jgi:hypothetical protein